MSFTYDTSTEQPDVFGLSNSFDTSFGQVLTSKIVETTQDGHYFVESFSTPNEGTPTPTFYMPDETFDAMLDPQLFVESASTHNEGIATVNEGTAATSSETIEIPYSSCIDSYSIPNEGPVVSYIREKTVAGILDHVRRHGVNAVANTFGQASVHLAVKGRVASMARYLIKQGADLEMKDDFGLTPLNYAVRVCKGGADYEGEGALEMVKVLLESGAKVDARSLLDAAWPVLKIDVALELMRGGGDVMATMELVNNLFLHHEFEEFCQVSTVLDLVERIAMGGVAYSEEEIEQKMTALFSEAQDGMMLSMFWDL